MDRDARPSARRAPPRLADEYRWDQGPSKCVEADSRQQGSNSSWRVLLGGRSRVSKVGGHCSERAAGFQPAHLEAKCESIAAGARHSLQTPLGLSQGFNGICATCRDRSSSAKAVECPAQVRGRLGKVRRETSGRSSHEFHYLTVEIVTRDRAAMSALIRLNEFCGDDTLQDLRGDRADDLLRVDLRGRVLDASHFVGRVRQFAL